MIRKSFLLQIKPGMAEEYERRHNPIWPELALTLLRYGIRNYYIFLHEPTNQLFGTFEAEDEERLKEMEHEDICQKWWKYMTDVLVCSSENPDKGTEEPLRMVFQLCEARQEII